MRYIFSIIMIIFALMTIFAINIAQLSLDNCFNQSKGYIGNAFIQNMILQNDFYVTAFNASQQDYQAWLSSGMGNIVHLNLTSKGKYITDVKICGGANPQTTDQTFKGLYLLLEALLGISALWLCYEIYYNKVKHGRKPTND